MATAVIGCFASRDLLHQFPHLTCRGKGWEAELNEASATGGISFAAAEGGVETDVETGHAGIPEKTMWVLDVFMKITN